MAPTRLLRRLDAVAIAMIDRAAITALVEELVLYPKAGLVSLVDTGSHRDMDARTFLRSTSALKGYFGAMALAGAEGASFLELKALGQAAEAGMFAATGGINTHRGAVFSLGLLAAASGIALVEHHHSAEDLCRIVSTRWGKNILATERPVEPSHGAKVRALYGAPGAREEAAAGFPTLTLHMLPAFRCAYEKLGTRARAGLHAFYAGMVILEDNNLLYRAGPEGLAGAQALADGFIRAGGMLSPHGWLRAVGLHRAFARACWSPGGAADLLILTLFLTRFEMESCNRPSQVSATIEQPVRWDAR